MTTPHPLNPRVFDRSRPVVRRPVELATHLGLKIYHRTFAREEAFINLITFADPARTGPQQEAVREWFDYVGATNRPLEELRKALQVVEHPQ